MVELKHSSAPPEIMHIDLNSAFAMTEQQANPLLRGKPVGVTNRISEYSICIAASYEAKRLGIGLGTRQREAKLIAPNFVILESDAPKYQYVHKLIKGIFESYSPTAYMKSIDEGIIDFTGMRGILKGRTMEEIGYEIKQRVRDEVGDYMTVNVGIGQNRWLAKVAAGLMKPDGLFAIDGDNIEATFAFMRLTELPYIKNRMRVRLNDAGIYTPVEFLRAPEHVLTKRVYKSINGHHWYLKLRGYETEVEFGVRTVGRSYVLEHRTSDPEEISALLYKAAAKVARRLRRNNLAARGLMLQLSFIGDGPGGPLEASGRGRYRTHHFWFERKMYKTAVRRADQLYWRALDLFGRAPAGLTLATLAITSYAVEVARSEQMALYESEDVRADRLEDAMNLVNDKYGELVLQPAAVMASKNPMKDKIPFGTIRYFDI